MGLLPLGSESTKLLIQIPTDPALLAMLIIIRINFDRNMLFSTIFS